MSPKPVNARQGHLSELLAAEYNFSITCCPGTQNPSADALTRRIDELEHQNTANGTQRLQQLLRDDRVGPHLITRELRQDSPAECLVPLIGIALLSPALSVIDQVIGANRISISGKHSICYQCRSSLAILP